MARANIHLQEIIAYAQNIVDTVRDPIVILDGSLHVLSANRAFYKLFHVSVHETERQSLIALGNGQWNIPHLVALLTETITIGEAFDDFEVTFDFPDIGPRIMLLNGRKLIRPESDITLLVLSIEDITVRKAVETELHNAQDQDKKIALAVLRPMLFQPVEDAFSGLLVQTAYVMASDEALVGGDFWDTFAYDHGHVAMVLGDTRHDFRHLYNRAETHATGIHSGTRTTYPGAVSHESISLLEQPPVSGGDKHGR